jgi:hypothetical protein
VATATFTFDARECTVWLDSPQHADARAGELCERHVNALTPPVGWRLDDRRASAVAAATAPRVAAAPGAIGRPVASALAADEVRLLRDASSPLLARAFRSAGSV